MSNEDLISQSELLKHRRAIMTPEGLAEYVPVSVIIDAPLPDAEEVNRCANCFWFSTAGYENENKDALSPLAMQGFCHRWQGETRGNCYCSEARCKRK